MFTDKATVLAHIDMLVGKYRYRALNNKLSAQSRAMYIEALPAWCRLEGEGRPLFTSDGAQIATGYDRIVVGDYGAFIEINRAQIIRESLCCQPGEAYRFRDPAYSSKVKYYWYTAKDDSGVKIYFQRRTVTYADYLPDYFYISPYECQPHP